MGIYLRSNKALCFKGLILPVVPGHLDFRNDLVISMEVVRNASHFKTSATPSHSKWHSKKLLLIPNHGNSAAAAIPHWGHKSDITRGFLTVGCCQGSFSSAHRSGVHCTPHLPMRSENQISPVQGELLTWLVLGYSGDENGIVVPTSLAQLGSLWIKDKRQGP